jgi:hypothetical protein
MANIADASALAVAEPTSKSSGLRTPMPPTFSTWV